MGFNVIYIDGIYNYFHGAYEYNNQWVILTYEFHDAGTFNGDGTDGLCCSGDVSFRGNPACGGLVKQILAE